jgi:hypothetical protein
MGLMTRKTKMHAARALGQLDDDDVEDTRKIIRYVPRFEEGEELPGSASADQQTYTYLVRRHHPPTTAGSFMPA